MEVSYKNAISGKFTKDDLPLRDNIMLKDDYYNLSDYTEWQEKKLKNLKRDYNRIEAATYYDGSQEVLREWHGASTEEELNSTILEFFNPEVIQTASDRLRDKVINLDSLNTLSEKELNFNEHGRGIFSFPLASQGLIIVMEYYDNEDKVVVPSELVKERLDEMGEKVLYDGRNGHILEHRKKIRTKEGEEIRDEINTISQALSSGSLPRDKKEILKNRLTELEGEIKKHYKYISTVKKSFIDIPKTKESKTVDIYIYAGGSARNSPEDLTYKSIGVVVLAEKLENMGFNVGIHAVYGGWNAIGRGDFIASVIPLKRYDDPIDINAIALATSDPRIFRWKTFKGMIAINDEFDRDLFDLYGYPSQNTTQEEHVEEELIKRAITEGLESDPNAMTNKSNYAKYFIGQDIASLEGAVQSFEDTLSKIKDTYDELDDKPTADDDPTTDTDN